MAIAVACALSLVAGRAVAHGLGMSQLRLRVAGPRVEGEWEVQLHDAQLALGLDATGGDPGWRDLMRHEASWRAYLAGRLALAADGRDCHVELTAAPMEWQPDQGQVLLHVASTCPSEPTHLLVRCDLLFDRDPRHRAYYSIEDARVTHVGVFRDDQRSAAVDIRQLHFWATLVEFVRDGVGHVLSGLDHMLFLLALLLPAPLVRTRGGWSPGPGLARTAREVVKVVTAFTVAHSVTLALSFFGVVTLPSRWVEVGIAVSVFAAAWNNLRPFLPGRAWAVALAFGLVHGLGFAGALRNLSLPIHARGLALAAFNVGVELGQLAIVALVLPLLVAGARRRAYPRLVLGGASLLIAWLAAVWVIERALGISLLAALAAPIGASVAQPPAV